MVAAVLLAPLRSRRRGGLPPGVFNVVQGIGEEVGAALTRSPGVRRISFTGSPETAVHIGTAAARNVVPFTGELGGKGPLLVFADADLEAAARKAAGQYDDAGQVCLAGTRVLVEESVADGFLELFDRFTAEHVLGDPRDDTTTVSPLIHPDHLARVEGFVERARANGDEIVRGGRRRDDVGPLFYDPTLVRPRSNDSEIVQREVFGPVLTFQTFADEDEAIALANSTPLRSLGDRLHRSRGARGARRARRCAPAPSGSTPSSSATSPRPSAGSGSRGSAARVAITRSTSTPT